MSDEKAGKKIKEIHDRVLDDLSEKYDESVEHGKEIVKEAATKIEETAVKGTEFIKSHPYWKSLKEGSNKIKEKSIEQSHIIKKQSPKWYRRINHGFFYFFETIVGRIKIGTQYGKGSIETLEQLARLKELGIINDEEFAKKKKKILDRI